MRLILVSCRSFGDNSFVAATVPSLGAAFSSHANDVTRNVTCTVNVTNWVRRQHGLAELPLDDDHPLMKVAQKTGAKKQFKQLQQDSSACSGPDWRSASSIGGSSGGPIGGKASVLAHGEQTRNGGSVGGPIGGKSSVLAHGEQTRNGGKAWAATTGVPVPVSRCSNKCERDQTFSLIIDHFNSEQKQISTSCTRES